jgi:hypothetical protein
MARRAGQSGAELGRNSSALHLALFDGSQSAERDSELVVKDRIDLSTFRFSEGLSSTGANFLSWPVSPAQAHLAW